MKIKEQTKHDADVLLDALPELHEIMANPPPHIKQKAQEIIKASKGMDAVLQAEGRRFWCGHK